MERDTRIELIEDAVIASGALIVYLRSDGTTRNPYTGTYDTETTRRDAFRASTTAGYVRSGARLGTEGRNATCSTRT